MQWLTGHKKDVRAVAYTPDGRLVSGSSDKTVRVWDPTTGACVTTIKAPNVVYAVAVSPDGSTIAHAGRYADAATQTNTVHFWNLTTGKPGPTWDFPWQLHSSGRGPFPRSIWSLAYSAGGGLIAAAGRVMGGGNIPNGGGGQWRELAGPRDGVLPEDTYAVAFAPTGTTLAATRLRAVSFYPAPGADEQARYPLQNDWANAVTFLPGTSTAVVAAASYLHVMDTQTVRRPVKLKTGLRIVTAVAVSPDGRSLLAGGKPGTVEWYDVATHARRRVYDFAIGGVYALAFAPDGITFAIGGDNGLVRCDVEDA